MEYYMSALPMIRTEQGSCSDARAHVLVTWPIVTVLLLTLLSAFEEGFKARTVGMQVKILQITSHRSAADVPNMQWLDESRRDHEANVIFHLIGTFLSAVALAAYLRQLCRIRSNAKGHAPSCVSATPPTG
jgi:hypothetical protein